MALLVAFGVLALTAAARAGGINFQVNINQGPPLGAIGYYGGPRPYYPPPPPVAPVAIGAIHYQVGPNVYVSQYRPIVPVVPAYPLAYTTAYVNLFLPGYQSMVWNNATYFYYPVLPPGATLVTVGGQSLYVAGRICYRPIFYGGQTVFMVVPPF
jgi:hypothetical protein